MAGVVTDVVVGFSATAWDLTAGVVTGTAVVVVVERTVVDGDGAMVEVDVDVG